MRLLSGPSGNKSVIGIFGEQMTGEFVSDIALSFDTEINLTYDLKTSVTGDGAVSNADSFVICTSTSGTAEVSTIKSTRYRAGHTGVIRFTASFTGNGTGYVGGFSADTGFYVKRHGGRSFFGYRNGNKETEVPISGTIDAFNTDSIDYEKLNIFEIQYGYLGVASPILMFYAPGAGRVKIADIRTQGLLFSTHIKSPYFPVSMKSDGAMVVKSSSWAAGYIGTAFEVGQGRPFHFSNGGHTVAGTAITTIGNFRASETYNGNPTRKAARLVSFNFFVDSPGSGSGVVEFKIIKNATLSGTPSYTDVSAGNSIMQLDSTAAYDSGGIQSETSWVGYISANRSGGTGSTVIDASRVGLVAYPGDVFTITAQNVDGTSTVIVRTKFNWEEY